ncbi:MAG: hypothetical protein ACYCRD_10205 [Leptospirillum sp.]
MDKLKQAGGKNVLLRLRRQEVDALDFLCRYYEMNKGEVLSKLIHEENRRISTLIMSDPEARAKFVKTPPPGK